MTIRKRHKASRYRGSRSHGRGFKNRTRGSGNRGGVGLSGTGKRGDQKKTYVNKYYGGDYFGKDKTLRTSKRVRTKGITLSSVIHNMHGFVKKGVAKAITGGYELDLSTFKLIGTEEVPFKLVVKARQVSEGARAAVEAAGGSVETRTDAADA